MYIRSLRLKITIDLAWKAQIKLLLVKRINVAVEYTDFANGFSKKLSDVLSKQTDINKYAIKLLDCKQLSYGPIYSLGLVKLETFKTYIKINLANGFIQLSKSLASTLISFVQKANNSLSLCVNYQGLNNLIIKNWYLLLLIGEFLD